MQGREILDRGSLRNLESTQAEEEYNRQHFRSKELQTFEREQASYTERHASNIRKCKLVTHDQVRTSETVTPLLQCLSRTLKNV